MRGKRFKAAVQTAFGQRGWTKGDDVTWKEVAHLVGLRVEDDESEWERVLQEGAQRGQRRQPGRGKTPRAHPATPGGQHQSTPTSPCYSTCTCSQGGHPCRHNHSRSNLTRSLPSRTNNTRQQAGGQETPEEDGAEQQQPQQQQRKRQRRMRGTCCTGMVSSTTC